ncbi:hypothetical protein CC80DRAFT_505365 [Byssothecium circinans]|uniref:Uncharacterized protein n=1 Tax=Byssothecium circinans TaxID=147558 RepID=A0A6A5TT55_9PLEO|nr:hypothetical protein CC80DRAFT_505365 [Byssothecium circinans]
MEASTTTSQACMPVQVGTYTTRCRKHARHSSTNSEMITKIHQHLTKCTIDVLQRQMWGNDELMSAATKAIVLEKLDPTKHGSEKAMFRSMRDAVYTTKITKAMLKGFGKVLDIDEFLSSTENLRYIQTLFLIFTDLANQNWLDDGHLQYTKPGVLKVEKGDKAEIGWTIRNSMLRHFPSIKGLSAVYTLEVFYR